MLCKSQSTKANHNHNICYAIKFYTTVLLLFSSIGLVCLLKTNYKNLRNSLLSLLGQLER